MHGTLSMPGLIDIRSRQAQRWRAHLYRFAAAEAWGEAPWLRRTTRTLDGVYIEPDVVEFKASRRPVSADAELRDAVAPPLDTASRRGPQDIWYTARVAAILGRPGEGKTTFLQRTCREVARRGLTAFESRTLPLADVPLPFWLPARLIMQADSFVAAMANADAHLPADRHLTVADYQAALKSPNTWLFIDALDEPPEGVPMERAWRALAALADCPARIVFSARSYAWNGIQLPSFTRPTSLRRYEPRDQTAPLVYQLAPLTGAQRRQFVEHWFVGVKGRLRASALLRQLDNRPVSELTSNALLLTLLCAALDTDSSRRLTPSTTKVELFHWLTMDLIGRGDDTPRDPLGAGTHRRFLALARAAWTLWQSQPGKSFAYRDWEAALRRACEDVRLTAAAFDTLETDIRQSGLLVPEAGSLRFFPQTAFEYLAAAGLAEEDDAVAQRLAAAMLAHGTDAAWRECLDLAVGYLAVIRGSTAPLRDAVTTILATVAAGPPNPAVTRLATPLAALGERGHTPGAGSPIVTAGERRRLIGELYRVMRSGPAIPKRARADAGDALAMAGDPRFHGPELGCCPNDRWHLEPGERPEVEDWLGFVAVPGGTVDLRHRDASEHSDADTAADTVAVEAFYMARWPLTDLQFHGRGTADPVRFYDRETLGTLRGYLVDLEHRLRASSETPRQLQALLSIQRDGEYVWRITLPTDAEWQLAAQRGGNMSHPWRGRFRFDHLNCLHPKDYRFFDVSDRTRQRSLDGPTVVGCFAAGANVDGVEELLGSVAELTRLDAPETGPTPVRDNDRQTIRVGGDVMVVRSSDYRQIAATAWSRRLARTRMTESGERFREMYGCRLVLSRRRTVVSAPRG